MDAQMAAFSEKLSSLSENELRETAMELYLGKRDIYRKYTALEDSTSEMAIQYQQMKGERDAALYEVKKLTKVNSDLMETVSKYKQMLFGTSSEKTSKIMSQPESSEVSDPLDEDGPSDEPDTGTPGSGSGGGKGGGNSGRKTKDTGRKDRRDVFEGMPERVTFEYDLDALNEEYGEGNWRFGPWHQHDTVVYVKGYSYHLKTYTPVISVGLEHTAVTVPWDGALIPKSYASSSLLSQMFVETYNMFIPLYRQEHDPGHYGFILSRQTASNWMQRCALEYLLPVYEYMKETVRDQRYQQCDETKYRVIEAGPDAGSIQYMWVHCTSELSTDPTIICYCYSSSRSADHLREFYAGLDHEIYLTSDAYSAYPAISCELDGLIVNCGCLMHARRRFADALLLLPAKVRSDESLPENRGIALMSDIYSANTPLGSVSPEERAAVRGTEVCERVDSFYDFVHETDRNDPSLSEKTRDALRYAVNNETELRRFLEDPFIPADNGFCERSVKAIALSRKNSLFSYSIKGAHVTAIACSLIATAKAHDADPYHYIKYLLDRMPAFVRPGSGMDRSYLEDMMPWSDSYKAYEKKAKEDLVWQQAPPDDERPKTPKKQAS